MKRLLVSFIALALLTAAPLVSVATVFFSDNFSASTLNSLTPTAPTATSTSYQIVSAKTWVPTPSIASGDLKFGIASTSSGVIEVQALFATSPLTLILPGDYIEMTVTFTNTAGLLTGAGSLGFGLYYSGQVPPVAGGLNGTATTSASDHATGNAQNWKGYVGYLGFTGSDCRIMNRAAQTGANNNNQELVTRASSSQSYRNPEAANVGSLVSGSPPCVTLTAGQTYTANLKILYTGANALAITNSLYAGSDASGTLLSQFGGVTTVSTFLTAGFDALAIGWRETGSQVTTIDISSIQISGSATPVSGPPEITVQPSPVSVPAGAAGAFMVTANGYSMTYQWRRSGTNLVDGGNISGATSDTLVISPASAADVASGANGYYVVITGAGGYSTNSITNSLSLRSAANLVWAGPGTDWDLNTSANWLRGASPSVFNFGDTVTFNNTGAANLTVNLTGGFLSAASVTVDSSYNYVLASTGSFAGPGKLFYIGPGLLTINNANSYSGGTLISNAAAFLVLNNYNGLGSGPVTLAQAGGTMEIVPAGGASTGIKGDVIVQDDFLIYYDANSSYGAVFLGNLAGTSGKTLTFTHNNVSPTASRVRVYGGATVCEANIALSNAETTFAPYNSSGSQTYEGVISGSGALMQKGTTTYLNGDNTYSGGTVPATGFIGLGRNSTGDPVTSGPIGTGPLFLTVDSTTTVTGNGGVLASSGPRSIANPIQYPSATNNLTLIIGGTNSLTISGAITLNGNDGVTPVYTNRTFQVTNTALTTFSGVISDGGGGFGLIKSGNGTLALNNTETYTGPTTVSNGTLQVNGSLAAASAVTVATNGTLGGTGTINGAVTVDAGGAIAPGTSIGTLYLNSSLAFAGHLKVEVNRSASPSSDKVQVNGALANTGTGTVTVTNLGPALQVGDTFSLFNKGMTGGGAMKVVGGGVGWNNQLAVNGTIVVASVGGPTLSATFASPTLTLNWPASYLGWLLQSNSVGVVSSANWVTLPNSDNATSFATTIDSTKANGVFFRLIQP